MNSTIAKDLDDMIMLLNEALTLINEDISNYRCACSSTQFYNLTVDHKWRSKAMELVEQYNFNK